MYARADVHEPEIGTRFAQKHGARPDRWSLHPSRASDGPGHTGRVANTASHPGFVASSQIITHKDVFRI